MYAIAIEMNPVLLREHFACDSEAAYLEIRGVLERHGLSTRGGRVFFGLEEVDAVRCVLAVQDLVRSLPWFSLCARSVRMLRIEEFTDLMPAVRMAAP